MFEITTQRWDAGRVIISRMRPLYETRELAQEALNNMKRNKRLIYNIRETEDNGN